LFYAWLGTSTSSYSISTSIKLIEQSGKPSKKQKKHK